MEVALFRGEKRSLALNRMTTGHTEATGDDGPAVDVRRMDPDALMRRSRSWASRLLGGVVHYFPVRHHSPICALRIRRWMHQHRPLMVVIEGPMAMNGHAADLAADDCRPPVAVLQTYRESDRHDAPRHSGFYPFCDYSPEWVAMRTAIETGARVRFADLDFGDKVSMRDDDRSVIASRLNEDEFRHSDFIAAITRQYGLRDFDQWWDHVFESMGDRRGTEELVGTLATYCDLARASDAIDVRGTADGDAAKPRDINHARESVMATGIAEAVKSLKQSDRRGGAVLVVTGGYHTVALPDRVDQKLTQTKKALTARWKRLIAGDEANTGRRASYLIRYSYDQLDALGGYQSGMPHPSFYESVWRSMSSGGDRENQPVAPEQRSPPIWLAETVRRVADAVAESATHPTSVTDAIAAVQMAMALRTLRNHDRITRGDVTDAIKSCFSKTAVEDSAAEPIAAAIDAAFRGDRIGSVPESAGSPPILDDFRLRCESLKLPHDTVKERTMSLDIYRKPLARRTSRFLHQLAFLQVPYASMIDGPDFVAGHRLRQLFENWAVQWSPGTEGALSTLASAGDSIAAAAATHLMRSIDDQNAGGDDAFAATMRLVRCLQMGLHDFVDPIIADVRGRLANEGLFHVAAAVADRVHAMTTAGADDPEGADHRKGADDREGGDDPVGGEMRGNASIGLTDLRSMAYRRSCSLIDGLAAVPDESVGPSIEGILSLRSIIADDSPVDAEWLYRPLRRLTGPGDSPGEIGSPAGIGLPGAVGPASGRPRSEIAGAAAGVLFTAAQIDAPELARRVAGYLNGSVTDPSLASGIMEGLASTARESFWRCDELIRQIDDLFDAWNDHRFRSTLPTMRLAMTTLSPSEIDRVAAAVAAMHGGRELGALVHADLTEADVAWATHIDGWLTTIDAGDGLDSADVDHQSIDVVGLMDKTERGHRTIDDQNPIDDQHPIEPQPDQRHHPERVARTAARWRLVLGKFAEHRLNPPLSPEDARRAASLEQLYGREYDARGVRGDRSLGRGSLDQSKLNLPKWMGEIRSLFPKETFTRITGHALDRYGLTGVLNDPRTLREVEPSTELLATVMQLKGQMNDQVRGELRRLIRRVVEDIQRRLKQTIQRSITGQRNRFARSVFKQSQNFDARRTIRENLKHYDPSVGRLMAASPVFFSRIRRHLPWEIILCVDQSGSMAASLIHSAVMAGAISGLPAIKVRLVVFDTAVVDLSDRVDDPVEILMSVQLGGGTDIGGAMAYCQSIVRDPSRTIVVLVTDFCEGGDPGRLRSTVRQMKASGIKLIGLASLEEDGQLWCDQAMASHLAADGMQIAAVTPNKLAEWLGEVMQGDS